MLAIKDNMLWLESRRGTIQRDSASPRTGKGTEEKLNGAGREGEWDIKLVTQPAQLLDLNINNIGFLAFLKSRA